MFNLFKEFQQKTLSLKNKNRSCFIIATIQVKSCNCFYLNEWNLNNSSHPFKSNKSLVLFDTTSFTKESKIERIVYNIITGDKTWIY